MKMTAAANAVRMGDENQATTIGTTPAKKGQRIRHHSGSSIEVTTTGASRGNACPKVLPAASSFTYMQMI
jgi:hypothetical protein